MSAINLRVLRAEVSFKGLLRVPVEWTDERIAEYFKEDSEYIINSGQFQIYNTNFKFNDLEVSEDM
jgi:hypothetical protein